MRFTMPVSAETTRRLLFELAVVIAGILIALWINGLAEGRRNDALVREAHASVRREIADNLRDVQTDRPALDNHQAELDTALRLTNDLLANRKSDITTLTFGLRMPTLNRASWQTADRSGALAHMAYDDVKAYTEIYSLQDLVGESQRGVLARLTGVMSLIATGDPAHAPRQDLESARSRLLDAQAGLGIHKVLVDQLIERYKALPPQQ